MTVLYQQVPVTLDPYTPIPDGAPLSSGLSEEGAAEVIAASETFASETAVGVDVTSTGLTVEVALSPTVEFADGFQIDWTWGDGRYETGFELTNAHDYLSEGSYEVAVTVTQPGEASFALSVPAVLDLEAQPV